jgi:endonuclease G
MNFNRKNQIILTCIGGAILYLATQTSIKDGVITLKYPNQLKKITKNFGDTNQTNNNTVSNTQTNSNSKSNSSSLDIAKDSSDGLVVDVDYGFFQLEYNCDKGGFNNFSYNTVPDPHTDYSRYGPFHYDSQIGELCGYNSEQIKKAKRTSTYKSPKGALKYDRGHGNHQNIWDHDKGFMKITNYMSNIVPQESSQNRSGMWRRSEELTQCFRQNNDLYVIGGNIWGNDSSNDHFIESHGVVTPDYLFKIIVKNNSEVIAFVVPNDPKARPKQSGQYMTSINKIEELVGYDFDIDESLKDLVTNTLPPKPSGCSIK